MVENNGHATNLRFLCELKEIFGTQLPKMPKEYIVRLVFDKKHKSGTLSPFPGPMQASPARTGPQLFAQSQEQNLTGRERGIVCAIKRVGGVAKVIGGICYRPYHKEKLGEIAFCAIKTEEQVRGYGTRLMNQTKHFAKTLDGLDHFVLPRQQLACVPLCSETTQPRCTRE